MRPQDLLWLALLIVSLSGAAACLFYLLNDKNR